MDRTTVSFLDPLGCRLNYSLDLWPHQEEVLILGAAKFVQPRVIRSEINCSFPVQGG